jgi:hypothetical protein
MSLDETVSGAEDLELEGAEAESVVGGERIMKFNNVHDYEHEVHRLAKQGYVECACIAGGTVMENPKTRRRITLEY